MPPNKKEIIRKSATIIAGTCVGFLSNDFVKDLDFDYVIIDEAAKATTPELLVSIIKSKKIVLVGDQNQLPAYADQELSPIISQLTKDPKYRLFDLLFNVLPDTHKQILTVQYRMKRMHSAVYTRSARFTVQSVTIPPVI